ncbi:hypothetical protein TNCV_2851091 [Trichonephila clavipes]|nr:hypothetical protein TNCV_2851091 [Trichonephila clavipes]
MTKEMKIQWKQRFISLPEDKEEVHRDGYSVGLLGHLKSVPGQRRTPELASVSPNFSSTPPGGRLSIDRFSMQRPTWRVFSGTGLELMTSRLPLPRVLIGRIPVGWRWRS